MRVKVKKLGGKWVVTGQGVYQSFDLWESAMSFARLVVDVNLAVEQLQDQHRTWWEQGAWRR